MERLEVPHFDFFISFPSTHEQPAKQLAASLKAKGRQVFISTDLAPGRNWPTELRQALEITRIFAVLIAPGTEYPVYEQSEIVAAVEMAKEGRLIVVPVLLREAQVSLLPLPLNVYQCLFEEKEPTGLHGIAERLSKMMSQKVETSFRVSGAVLHAVVLEPERLAKSTYPRAAARFFEESLVLFGSLFGPVSWANLRGDEFTALIRPQSAEARSATLAKCLAFGLYLQLAARGDQNAGGDSVALEMSVAIHWEYEAEWRALPARIVSSNNAYFIGAGLDYARTLLTVFSDRPYILLSESAFQILEADDLGKLMAQVVASYPQLTLPAQQSEYRTISLAGHDMHKRLHKALSICVASEGRAVLGDDRTAPERVPIEYRSAIAVSLENNTFVRRLTDADRVIVIGITNEDLEKYLRKALSLRKQQGKQFWSELKIVFPSEHILDTIVDQHDLEGATQARVLRRDRWSRGKKLVNHFLLSQPADDRSRWRCLEFPGALSFVGQRFTLHDAASIRVAPLLPGCDMKESYYMEVFQGTHVFQELDKAFSVMVSKGRPLVEWNVCTSYHDDKLSFWGIVNRTRQLEARNNLRLREHIPCFPVVLIMLHTSVGQHGFSAVLQKRTMYNSARDFNKYSNISGWLTSDDLWLACQFERHPAPALPGYAPDPDTSDDFEASLDFAAATDYKIEVGGEMPDDLLARATLVAAVRELREELGLVVTPDRLKAHESWMPLAREDGTSMNLFRLFSLQVTRPELREVKIRRPTSDLDFFRWDDLQHLHSDGSFNHLLQTRFDDVFSKIYEKLGVKPKRSPECKP